MNILVIGAGAIGVYLGTKLFSSKHNVTLLGRKKLKKLHDTIIINDEVFRLPKRLYKPPKNKSYDYIFITSKLYDLDKNIELIQNNNLTAKITVSIQNGIVNTKHEISSVSVYEGFRLIDNQLIKLHFSKKFGITQSRKDNYELLRELTLCCREKNLL
jgi:ketopantoate reductase